MIYDYLKFIRWSEEDQVFVGYCPDLFIGGVCHGNDEQKVYKELCSHVASELEELKQNNKPTPEPRAMVAVEFTS